MKNLADVLFAVDGILGEGNVVRRNPGQYNSRDIVWILYKPTVDLAAVGAELRAHLNSMDWLFITTGGGWSISDFGDYPCFGITEVVRRAPSVAYHATRQAVIPTILKDGLLPSNEERRSTTFPDTEGVIHVCEKLRCTSGENDGVEWWRDHLSKNNRFGDPHWGIVSVELEGLGARIYEDMHSRSGLIVDRIERIPPERIAMVGVL